MSQDEQLTDAVVTVNNEQIGIVPGSLSYSEGLGGRQILPRSEGGGRVSQVFATDQSTAFGRVKFAVYATPDDIKRVRGWMVNRNRNAVVLSGSTGTGSAVTRSFTQACVMNDPDIPFSVDGRIDVEWQSNSPI